MKLSEAYDVLNLKPDASAEDVKKRSRELMKTYHPDVNKDPGAEAKFKRVNEATERIKSGEPDIVSSPFGQSMPFDGAYDLGSIFETMFGGRIRNEPRQNFKRAEDISLRVVLSFEEAVTGTQKTIKYTVNQACQACDGAGSVFEGSGCVTCGGRGIVEQTRVVGNMRTTTRTTCPTCRGNVKMKPCQTCSGSRVFKRECNQQVHIPPGVKEGSTLRVRNAGNAVVYPSPTGYNTDVILRVSVEASTHGLVMEDNAVLYTAQISLLEALRGTKIKVPTVFGEREIEIPVLSKHKDKVRISGHGVACKGDQVVTLHINYPADVNELVKILEKK